MRDQQDGTTPAPSTPETSGAPLIPTHVFDNLYLRLLAHRDEPYTGSEADVAGPWHLEKTATVPIAYAVLRQGESLRRGDEPHAVFTSEDAAHLCIATLPVAPAATPSCPIRTRKAFPSSGTTSQPATCHSSILT